MNTRRNATFTHSSYFVYQIHANFIYTFKLKMYRGIRWRFKQFRSLNQLVLVFGLISHKDKNRHISH